MKKNTTGPKHIVDSKKELKNIHTIPEDVLNRDDVVLAKITEREIGIDDGSVSFFRLNCFLKKKGIVTKREFKKLEYVREERKRLHLQSLSQPDTGYTKKKAVRVAEPLGFLVKKL